MDYKDWINRDSAALDSYCSSLRARRDRAEQAALRALQVGQVLEAQLAAARAQVYRELSDDIERHVNEEAAYLQFMHEVGGVLQKEGQ